MAMFNGYVGLPEGKIPQNAPRAGEKQMKTIKNMSFLIPSSNQTWRCTPYNIPQLGIENECEHHPGGFFNIFSQV